MDFKHTNLPIELDWPKLVRDEIPQNIRDNEKIEPIYHVADKEEFKKYLLKKVIEEATELQSSPNKEEMVKELADMKEIVLKIMEVEGIGESDIEEVRLIKRQKRGGFDKKYILEGKKEK